ncbi:MAG: YncE family protein [Bacteroidota bacterium]
MKTNLNLFYTLTLLSFLLFSCSSDDDFSGDENGNDDNDDTIEMPYENGFFVLNEGGVGSLTFISNDFSTQENTIFSNHNEGEDLGVYVQSMFFDDDKAFIISNGSNMITVVNRYTMEFIGRVETDLDVPRYGVAVDGKAYVTNQGDFTTDQDDYLSVIDIETLEVENTITIGGTGEFIQAYNNQLYLLNATYGQGNSLSVFDMETQSITTSLEIGEGLNSMAIYNDLMFVLGSDFIYELNLNSLEIQEQVALPESLAGSTENLRIYNDKMYFSETVNVYEENISSTEISDEPIYTYEEGLGFGTFYGFEVHQNQIYIADPKDFDSSGAVQVLTTEGELLQEFEVDLGPNGFYFND